MSPDESACEDKVRSAKGQNGISGRYMEGKSLLLPGEVYRRRRRSSRAIETDNPRRKAGLLP
jgi:hypothetical protein